MAEQHFRAGPASSLIFGFEAAAKFNDVLAKLVTTTGDAPDKLKCLPGSSLYKPHSTVRAWAEEAVGAEAYRRRRLNRAGMKNVYLRRKPCSTLRQSMDRLAQVACRDSSVLCDIAESRVSARLSSSVPKQSRNTPPDRARDSSTRALPSKPCRSPTPP